MKSKIFYLIIVLLSTSCTVDNYKVPNIALSGKIIDSKTGQLVPSSGANNGTVVKMFEGNSNQPLLFNTRPDGTFRNSRLFADNYRVVAEGPFKSITDTLNVDINADTKIELKVLPNIRLELSSQTTGDSMATVKIKYTKVNKDSKMMKLGVVWSTYPYPNETVFPEGNIILEDVSSSGLTEGEKTYKITKLKPQTKYYVRALGLGENEGNYYNYSTQIAIQTP